MKTVLLLVALFSGLIAQALNPQRTYAVRPSDYGLNYEEITIITSDSVHLKGWLYKPSEPSSKMIILSDDGDGNMADLIEIATSFTSIGYNVLTYDYRGYGESDDFTINNSFYIYTQFERDLTGAIDYVRKYHSKCRSIALYGQGIGGAMSLAAAANRSDFIGKVIADSPYSTLEDVKAAIKETSGADVLLPLGFDKLKMEPVYALEAKGASLNGILIIYGKDDPVYNDKMIKRISKLRAGITQTYEVKDATKATTFSIDKEKYFRTIKEFLI